MSVRLWVVNRFGIALTMALVWLLGTLFTGRWTAALYNFDGEWGVTPGPPLAFLSTSSAVIIAIVVAAVWLAWRTFGAGERLWLFVFAGFVAKGLILATLGLVSLRLYGAAPFTERHVYLEALIDIATAAATGTVVAILVALIERRSRRREEAAAFD